MKKLSHIIAVLFLCKFLGDHRWTSKGLEGAKPKIPKGATDEEIIAMINDHAHMYCRRCGKSSKLNQRFKL